MVVSKDISAAYPHTPPSTFAPQLISRTGTLKAESSIGSEEEFGKLRSDYPSSKSDNHDNVFMEDVCSLPLPCDVPEFLFLPIPDHIGYFLPFRREPCQGPVHGLRLAICAAGRALRRGN